MRLTLIPASRVDLRKKKTSSRENTVDSQKFRAAADFRCASGRRKQRRIKQSEIPLSSARIRGLSRGELLRSARSPPPSSWSQPDHHFSHCYSDSPDLRSRSFRSAPDEGVLPKVISALSGIMIFVIAVARRLGIQAESKHCERLDLSHRQNLSNETDL